MNPLILLAGIAAAYFITKKSAGSGGNTAAQKTALINWVNSGGDSIESKLQWSQMLNVMSVQEIADIYNYVFNYMSKNIYPQQGSTLYNSIQAISYKYNIFS
jgi:hypothetical protein